MADPHTLAELVRAALKGVKATRIREVKMFGGIGFMLNGNLLMGASPRGLLVRVGAAAHRQAINKSGVRPMVMRGRTMVGYVFVDPAALSSRAVSSWVRLASRYVMTLPPKAAALKRPRARRGR